MTLQGLAYKKRKYPRRLQYVGPENNSASSIAGLYTHTVPERVQTKFS